MSIASRPQPLMPPGTFTQQARTRPQPSGLDLGEVLKMPPGTFTKQAAMSPSSTLTPSSGGRSLHSFGSVMQSPVLPLTISQEMALSSGQYPPGVGWTPVAKQSFARTSITANPTSSMGSNVGGASFGSPRSSVIGTTSIIINPTSSMVGVSGVGSPKSSIIGTSGMKLAPKPSPTGSITIQASSDRAFPPGFGFTPLAASGLPLVSKSPFCMTDSPQLSRANSFSSKGSPNPSPFLSRANSKESVRSVSTPHHLKRTISKSDDGSICKELLLIFRDEEATVELSSEEAGFVWPQPGWLRARSTAEELPAKVVVATVEKSVKTQSSQPSQQQPSQRQKAMQHHQQQKGSAKLSPVLTAQMVEPSTQNLPKQHRQQHLVTAAVKSVGPQQLQGATQYATTQSQRYPQQGVQQNWQTWQEDWSWQGGNDAWQWSQAQSTQQASWSVNGTQVKTTSARKGKGKSK